MLTYYTRFKFESRTSYLGTFVLIQTRLQRVEFASIHVVSLPRYTSTKYEILEYRGIKVKLNFCINKTLRMDLNKLYRSNKPF